MIRGIPLEVSSDELLEKLKESNPLLTFNEVECMKRRIITEGKSELIAAESVKVIIRGKKHLSPDFIHAWNVRLPVSPFIPNIRQCIRCGLLNHSAKLYKNSEKCFRCGNDEHDPEGKCEFLPKCRNCNR